MSLPLNDNEKEDYDELTSDLIQSFLDSKNSWSDPDPGPSPSTSQILGLSNNQMEQYNISKMSWSLDITDTVSSSMMRLFNEEPSEELGFDILMKCSSRGLSSSREITPIIQSKTTKHDILEDNSCDETNPSSRLEKDKDNFNDNASDFIDLTSKTDTIIIPSILDNILSDIATSSSTATIYQPHEPHEDSSKESETTIQLELDKLLFSENTSVNEDLSTIKPNQQSPVLSSINSTHQLALPSEPNISLYSDTDKFATIRISLSEQEQSNQGVWNPVCTGTVPSKSDDSNNHSDIVWNDLTTTLRRESGMNTQLLPDVTSSLDVAVKMRHDRSVLGENGSWNEVFDAFTFLQQTRKYFPGSE